MRRVFLFFILLTLSLTSFAEVNTEFVAPNDSDSIPPQRDIVVLGIDEKLIYVNELGLPPNTMVVDVLAMFPELLDRNINDILNRYDVQLDGVSVGFNKYNVLAHTMISEIHHVEISTDPSVSQSTSGVGGVINIVTLAVDSGFSGQVSLDVSSDFRVMPSVALAYKKNKLTIYGSAMFNYYDYKEEEKESLDYSNAAEWRFFNNYYKGFSEALKFGLAYQFNKYDKLTFWAMQNLDNYTDSTSQMTHFVQYVDKNKTDIGTYLSGYSYLNAPALHSQTDVILKFERLYDRRDQKLYASLTYSNNYKKDENKFLYSGLYNEMERKSGEKYSKYISRPHNISTSIYYRFHLLPESAAHILKLKPGLNFNMGFANGTDYSVQNTYKIFDDYTQDYTLTPYLTFNYEYSKIQMELSMKYRFKVRRGRGGDSSWQNNFYNDVFGNFNFTYTPVKNHQLRTSTSRSITTPSNLQLYSKKYYNQIENKWYQGVSSLKEPILYNVDLQYSYQYSNKRHELQLSAAVEYVNSENLIYQTTIPDTLGGAPTVTWKNSDVTNHIIDGRVSLFWQTGLLSVTFGANFYDNIQKPENSNKRDNMFYYNLMVLPVLHFEKGWIVSGQCIYNSHIYHGDITKGDVVYMELNVSKAWGPWSARLTFENTYDYLSTDIQKSGNETITKEYNQNHCQILVGFSYKFDREKNRK